MGYFTKRHPPRICPDTVEDLVETFGIHKLS